MSPSAWKTSQSFLDELCVEMPPILPLIFLLPSYKMKKWIIIINEELKKWILG